MRQRKLALPALPSFRSTISNYRVRGHWGSCGSATATHSNELCTQTQGHRGSDGILCRAPSQVSPSPFSLINTHAPSLFTGGWQAQNFLLKGYFQGKKDAEARLFERFPGGGVALRPGFVYGTRAVGSASIPLGLVGAPLAAVRRGCMRMEWVWSLRHCLLLWQCFLSQR
jgi:hypothetical protein